MNDLNMNRLPVPTWNQCGVNSALFHGHGVPAAGLAAQQLNLYQFDMGTLSGADAGEGSGHTVFGVATHHLHQRHTAGVLTGNADKILRGTIDFRRGAKRGVGHESEDVLLFSPHARNRTAPLILCGEEEVEGQHAASIGRLDEAKLYYLRSRGLNDAQARRLMVDARFAPAIEKIPLEALREEVRAEAARRLDETC